MSADQQENKQEEPKQPIHFWVNGVVALRDQMPYVQLSNENGVIAQMSMNQARQVAQDILVMASRTECDAMIFQFFEGAQLPKEAAAMLMQQFRDFRAKLDDEKVEHSNEDNDE